MTLQQQQDDFYQLLCSQDVHVIEDARLDAEKGMFLLEGAMQLLSSQEQDCASTGTCPVCCTQLLSPAQLAHCLSHLRAKLATISKTRNLDAVAVHEQCVAALRGVKGRQASSPRLDFYLRLGRLSEWRSQKAESLTVMHCAACASAFSTAKEFSDFLRRADLKSSAMERELHVHAKFCPLPSPRAASAERAEGNSRLSPALSPVKRMRMTSAAGGAAPTGRVLKI